MANRVFQGVVYQMKDASRPHGAALIDETGTVISCSELGPHRRGARRRRRPTGQTAGDAFVRDGYAYHQFSPNAKRNDYAVSGRGHRRATALR